MLNIFNGAAPVATYSEGEFEFVKGTDPDTKSLFESVADLNHRSPQAGHTEGAIAAAFREAGYDVTIIEEPEPLEGKVEY